VFEFRAFHVLHRIIWFLCISTDDVEAYTNASITSNALLLKMIVS